MEHIPGPEPPLSLEFLEAVQILMTENNLQIPLTVEEAIVFYMNINNLFHTMT